MTHLAHFSSDTTYYIPHISHFTHHIQGMRLYHIKGLKCNHIKGMHFNHMNGMNRYHTKGMNRYHIKGMTDIKFCACWKLRD